METNMIIVGDALAELKKLPDESVDCVMTSPPYWGLRDYGTAAWEGGNPKCGHLQPAGIRNDGGRAKVNGFHGSSKSNLSEKPYNEKCGKCGAIRKDQQLGLEPDFRDYINNLCDVFDEVKRVLKKTGTLWINLGDSYGGTGDKGEWRDPKYVEGRNAQSVSPSKKLPPKSLGQIPSRFAIAMTERGWILRNEIIWYKKNVMPSSVKDRFTVDFEKIFFFTKSGRYYFEQQFEPLAVGSDVEYRQKLRDSAEYDSKKPYKNNFPKSFDTEKRNKRTVWQIPTKPLKDAHFAVFPEGLCETPIRAGCPEFVCKKCGKPRIPKLEYTERPKNTGNEARKVANLRNRETGQIGKTGGTTAYQPGASVYPTPTKRVGWTECSCGAGFEGGVVLDPFIGSGTVAVVAEKLNRRWVGIELNPEYARLAEKRIHAKPKPML